MTSPAVGETPGEVEEGPEPGTPVDPPATAVDGSSSAAEGSQPVVVESAPVVDESAPVVDESAPVAPTAAPRVSTAKRFAAWLSRIRPSWLRPFRAWTLRGRIVTAVVGLLAALCLVIGTVSVLVLSSYLIDRLDAQLNGVITRSTSYADRLYGSGPIDARIDGIVSNPAQPQGTMGIVISNGTVAFGRVLSSAGSANEVTVDSTAFKNLRVDGSPQSVYLGPALHEYRVAAVQLLNGDVMIMGLPLSDANATVARLTLVIVLVSVAGLLLAVALAELIVRVALRPLDRVAATAVTVSEMPLDRGDVALSIRVPDEDTNVQTEVGKVGSALNRMLGHVGSALAARQASEQKVRQFVADASHELRTPLASIRGYSELTRRSPHQLPEDVTHSIARIESEATRMTSLVEDLLLLARLDEGRDLECEPVDLSMLLVDAVSDAHAAGTDHVWSLDLPGEPVIVPGDRARLHQVFVNLLANARIHTPPGTEVKVGLVPADEEQHRVSVTITDNGPGISPDIASTLFERFVRGDSSRTRSTGSTGLGLAIVHAVVEAHGGSVTVESEPGSGTTFRVELPAEEADQAE